MARSTLAKPQSSASCCSESVDEHKPKIIDHLRRAGDEPLVRSGFLSPDPLKVALSGFPDVNTYRAYYEGARNEFD